jgi:hypothetical protein
LSAHEAPVAMSRVSLSESQVGTVLAGAAGASGTLLWLPPAAELRIPATTGNDPNSASAATATNERRTKGYLQNEKPRAVAGFV